MAINNTAPSMAAYFLSRGEISNNAANRQGEHSINIASRIIVGLSLHNVLDWRPND